MWIFEFCKFGNGNDFSKIESSILGSDLLKLVFKIFGHKLPINTGSGLNNTHLRAYFKILRILLLIEKKVAPGKLKVNPNL